MVAHPCIRRIWSALFPTAASNLAAASPSTKAKEDDISPRLDSSAAEARLKQRVQFDFWFALIFIAALHGFSSLKVLAILFVNYTIATRLPRAYIPPATWVYNIGILFADELLHGYPYVKFAELISAGSTGGPGSAVAMWCQWLDDHSGLVPRWEVLFKVTILRLISFNLDYYWSLDYRAGSPIEVCNQCHLISP